MYSSEQQNMLFEFFIICILFSIKDIAMLFLNMLFRNTHNI